MFDLDNWQEIAAVLKANKLRTFLTAFGVFWGIFMLMVMLGFGSSMQTATRRQMKGMATNLLFIWGMPTTKAFDGLPPGRLVQFKTDDIELIRGLPGVEWVAPRIQLGGWMNNFNVSYEGKTGSFNVFGDYPDLRHIVAFQYQGGRFINERDIAENRKVAVIGDAVRNELIPADVEPIGKYIKLSGVYFQIVGVTSSLGQGQRGDRDAHTVFVPFTTMKSAFHTGDNVGFFAMTAKPGIDGPELEREVRAALYRQHRVDPSDELAIGSFNLFVFFDKLETVFSVLYWLSWVVGGSTLAAGAVGVMNIMLITVRERTKEFGVRKALGAKPATVIAMVVKETITLTALAGLIGITFGTFVLWAAGKALENAPNAPFGPPELAFSTVMSAVGVLVGVGALAGILPAANAAAIKPVEALRAE